jgi:hypothetical protein
MSSKSNWEYSSNEKSSQTKVVCFREEKYGMIFYFKWNYLSDTKSSKDQFYFLN